MTHPRGFFLNDHRFLEAVSCPLKLPFLLQDSELAGRPPVFRQKNKLRLRDAVALQFENRRQTSDSFVTAAKETKEWLREPEVAICGAVIQAGNLLARIPVLVKNANHLTIVQVHGKLHRQPGRTVLLHPERKRSTATIALKAAYRAEILSRVLPDASVDVSLYFPKKGFLAEESGLHGFTDDHPESEQAFQELFAKVEASEAMNLTKNKLPGIAVHADFEGLSVKEAIQKIIGYSSTGNYLVERHAGCIHCPYRKSKGEESGCWETFFPDTEILQKKQHVPDLPGYGNPELMQKGLYFQEEVEVKDGYHAFDHIERNGGPVITQHQRRDLQILSAKKEKKPLLWIKKSAGQLWSLKFPLHFIDFEAATYAIPMRKGDRPYTPLYFQFSCHTLREDGSVQHSGWLHNQPEVDDLHAGFAKNLLEVPDIDQGTIVHYSPFEKQAIHRILGEFQRDEARYRHEIELLHDFLGGGGQGRSDRFADLSEYIKQYYYNSYMMNSLGLKDTLESVLKLEQNDCFKIRNHEVNNQMNVRYEFMEQLQPYQNVRSNDLKIADGSAAMHAWIAQKNGLLSSKDSKEIYRLLYAYCEIDSKAMLFLYKHILRHVTREQPKDTILF